MSNSTGTKQPTARNAPYFWQATVETILPITAERRRILQRCGECTWPANRPLINNRATIKKGSPTIRTTKQEKHPHEDH